MLTPADEFLRVILLFQRLFSKPVFRHVKLLLAGAVLSPGKRTVSAVLRIVGLKAEKNFHKYHRVLSLVEWSALEAGRILLKMLLACFLPVGEIIIGIDETLERRWAKRLSRGGFIGTVYAVAGLILSKAVDSGG
jgi:hypothetical protein